MHNQSNSSFPRVSGAWDLEPIIRRLEADEMKYYPYILKSAANEVMTQQDHLAMKVILDRMQSLVDELEDYIEQLRPIYEPVDTFDYYYVQRDMTYFASYTARLINSSAQILAKKITEWVNQTNSQGAAEQYKLRQLALQKFKGFIAKYRSHLDLLMKELDGPDFEEYESSGSSLEENASYASEDEYDKAVLGIKDLALIDIGKDAIEEELKLDEPAQSSPKVKLKID